MKFKRLRLMGDGPGGADHLDLIGKPEDKAETLTAIYSFIQSGRYCDEIRFENVIGNSTTVDLFRNFSSIKNSLFPRSSISVTSVCPQIDLSGGWDTLLQKCKRRNEFIRKLRKLERFPDFEYRSVISPDETGAAFERFLCLHNSGWQGRGGSDLTGHPRLVSFQRQLVREISRVGLVRFEELWVDGECRCSIYGLDDGNTFYNYNTGYDRDYSHLSVGLILLGLSIKNSIERCNTTYDFLRGDETYKSDWANRRSDISTVCLSRNTVPAIAYEQMGKARDGFRDYSKSALPAAITESLAAYRRTRKRNHLLSGR